MVIRARHGLVLLLALLVSLLSCTAILGIDTDYSDNPCNTGEKLSPLECGIGACHQLVPACDATGLPASCPEATSKVDETPNGVDDNCDGLIDDGFPCEEGARQDCYSGSPLTRNVGLCHDGVQECRNGVWGDCIQDLLPAEELCDQRDNDCDGQVDEDCECAGSQTQPCYGGAESTAGNGACKAGTQKCENGRWGECNGDILPGIEECNGYDDDCDGEIDPDPPCPCQVGQTRTCFPDDFPLELEGVGECIPGIQECEGGSWGPCTGYGTPKTETCNGLDDDCNTQPDDGDLGDGGPCNVPDVQGPCKNGVYVCSAAGLICQQLVFGEAEICNGIDDDCDGVPDDGNPQGGTSCVVAGNPQPLGQCAVGEVTCEGGALVCKQVNLPAPETCNALDDNCDSFIDNGNLCCPDGLENGTETDVDCGGPCTAKCATNQKCVQDFDCQSKVCTNGFCIAPTCNDSTQNGSESDVDCGGVCPIKCGIGQSCNAGTDCVSVSCDQNICIGPTCNDLVKNGSESDVDCGGLACPECQDGADCLADSDCMSSLCFGSTCQVPTCFDTVQNGGETDVDCGGTTCTKCNTNKKCIVPSDCLSGVCDGQLCQSPTCTDQVKNGSESDVDCGGACSKCPDGQLCNSSSDCASNVCQNGFCAKKPKGALCSAADECAAGHCVDGVCCETACSGLCLACTNAKKGFGGDGDCGPVANGADPDNECVQQDVSTCDQTGACNGAGACALYPYNTICAPAACDANGVTLIPAGRCDGGVGGNGTCVIPPDVDCSPSTCSSATCTLSCQDDSDCAPNAYCNGSTCIAKKDDGQPCSAALMGNDCESGSCVDGVCCNLPCQGECEACTAAKKGDGTPTGLCGNIAVDLDPDNECSTQSPSTCGRTGVCSGSGSCQLYPSTTTCSPADCAAATEVDNADTCDGSGTCVSGGVTNCGPYQCVAGACTQLKVNGAICASGAECVSGNCVDGVCCNTACAGGCDVCTTGTCTNVTGVGSPSCSPYVCTGATADCPGTCSSDAGCVAGYFCSGSLCVPKLDNGQSCGASSQCQSGNCVEGVCCNTACTGGCDSCTTGTCTNVTGPGSPTCAPYVCTGATAVCPTSCVDSSGCAAGYYCSGGVCASKLANGVSCSSGADCQSGNCVEGVCCNSACNGSCNTCMNPGNEGTCTNVTGAGDPTCSPFVCTGASGACPSSCASNAGCATGYYCSGGACVSKLVNGASCTAGTDCQSGNCVDGVCCNTTCGGQCDSCAAPGSVGTCSYVTGPGDPTCSPYVCGGSSPGCLNTCADDAQCAAGYYCSGGACVVKLPTGQSCSAPNQCQSGHCVDGICCGTACGGSCDVCASSLGASADGTCTLLADGAAGSPSCTPYRCDGTSPTCPATCAADADCAAGSYCTGPGGSCAPKLAQGASCTASTQCQSGNCVDGYCCSSACVGNCDVCAEALGSTANGSCTVLADGAAGDPACTPYLCGGAASCPTTCAADADCVAGSYCTGSGGSCVPKLAQGVACTAPNQCQGGNCVDGYCCSSACGGSCDVCAQALGATADGACTLLGDGAAGMPACTTYLCDGVSADCPTTCAADADCVAGSYCAAGGSCALELAQGTSCTASNQCSSGHCVDGFCCESDCTGSCQACSTSKTGSPSGTCALIPSGSDPDSECAEDPVETCDQDGTCDGAGGCRLRSIGTVCSPATCQGDSIDNEDTCDGLGDCVPGGTTSCNGFTCVNGACTSLKVNGQSCTQASECSSGYCVDDVCCESECIGTCNACSSAKKGAGLDGVCGAISAGTDPDDECALEDQSTCGQTGQCDGSSQCQLYPMGVECVQASCADFNTVANANQCDGNGVCVEDGLTTECNDDQCDGGACTGLKSNGIACSLGSECFSGSCVDAVCCDTACSGACEACTAALQGMSGADGVCGPAEGGTYCSDATCEDGSRRDPSTCDGSETTTCSVVGALVSCGDYTCSGGTCLTNCTVDADCASGLWCDSSNTCRDPVVLLVGGNGAELVGASYHPGDGWSPPSVMSGSAINGADVAISRAGGVAVSRPIVGNLDYATWDLGTEGWTRAALSFSSSAAPAISAMGGSARMIYLDGSFQSRLYSGSWGSAVSTGATAQQAVAADVAHLSSGAAVVVYADQNDIKVVSHNGTSWGGGTSIDSSPANVTVSPTIVALDGGTAELMAVFVNSDGNIFSQVRTDGTWSTTALQIGGATDTTTHRVAVAPLPDGGAIAAYRGADAFLYTSVYTPGATPSWSTPVAFQTGSPLASVPIISSPAIARGTGAGAAAALVELAYILNGVSPAPDTMHHARCTSLSASACTWTTPVEVSTTNVATIAIASRP